MILTSREKAILLLEAQGFKNEATCRRMGLAVRTLTREWASIQRKLDASNRSNAVAIALLGDIFTEIERRIIRKRVILSRAEFVILSCLTGERTASEVSRILSWPERTVRHRASSLKGKCGIVTSEEARHVAECFSYLAV